MRTIRLVAFALCLSVPAFAQEGEPTEAPAEAAAETDVAVPDDMLEGERRDEPADARIVTAAPNPTGATGLLRTAQATGMEPGTFGLFLYTEYFSGKNVVRDGDETRRFVGRLGLSFTPIEYVEAWVRLGARATTNTFGDPRLIQSVGDFGLGVKGMYELTDGLHAGLMLDLDFPAGSNSVGLDFGATSVDIVALFTADLTEMAEIPLRLHLNAGYYVDNSSRLFPVRLDRVERFGHYVYDTDRALIALAADAPLPYATPFLEYTIEIPTTAPCDGDNPQLCVSEQGFKSYPSWLTVGVRSQPVYGLSFLAAMDLGMTTAESQGVPAVPAWNLVLGASYALNPFQSGRERIVEVPVEVPVGVMTSYVEGFVQDSGSGEPIADATITYAADRSPQLSDGQGRFRTYDFEPGTELTLTVSHPNYVSREFAVTVAEEPVSGPLQLEPAFEGALLIGMVDTASPVDATVSLRGEAGTYDLAVEDGMFEGEVAPGTYDLVVHALGYEAYVDQVEFSIGRVELAYELTALPPDGVYRRTADELAIDSPADRIAFEGDDLTQEAQQSLNVLTGLLAEDPSLRLLIRAHTDPQDDVEAELELTAERAEAVKAYLVARGIDASRLETDGVGSAEPKYPNVTERNMRLNNRVEFQILR